MPDNSNSTNRPPVESAIRKSRFSNFMTSLFGFRRNADSRNGVEFTKVDVDSSERIGQAFLNVLPSINNSKPLSDKLEKLFNAWMNDTNEKMDNLLARKQRIEQLKYTYLNDPYIYSAVELYADETTQVDDQDTLIQIETPDPEMTKTMYSLLNRWGITPTRLRNTALQLGLFGDAFWSNKITENGVEYIIPLEQTTVLDRIEFNPAKVIEDRQNREGFYGSLGTDQKLLRQMLDSIEETNDIAEIFDKKLFGFQVAGDIVVPPWAITHFRFNPEMSEFYPFGTSPILGALSSSKQVQSTITLQALARSMAFPTTVYTVKTDENMDEGRQFAVVDRVREAYDNIGVSPVKGGSEVYTVNTKIWAPENLIKVEQVGGKSEGTPSTDDLEIYMDREALALKLPRGFFGKDGKFFGGEGVMSGRALAEQYKPLHRRIYAFQSAMMDGIADLFRIHFAITGAYDFRTPFTLSMKYPVIDGSEDVNKAQTASIELTDKVINIVKEIIGIDKEESLPPDIIRDIVNKYTFLDTADMLKWTRDAKYKVALSNAGGEGEEGGEGGDEGFGGMDFGGGGEDLGGEVSESIKRVSHIRENYRAHKGDIYFRVLEEAAIGNYVSHGQHIGVFNQIPTSLVPMLETLGKENNESRLRESEDTSTETV